MPTWDDMTDVILFAIAGLCLGQLFRYVRYLNRPVALRTIHSVASYSTWGLLAGVGTWLLAKHFGWTIPSWDWVLVSFLGATVGVGELASRYRDAPIKAILSVPASLYVLLNAAAAALALLLGRHFGLWTTKVAPVDWAQVLAAGLGAMVILRSSLFQVRVGDNKDVGVGPSSFLQSVIDAADRAVDRLRAQERAWAVANVMEGISSEKAMTVLPLYISTLLQNLRPEDQSKFDDRVEKIRTRTESDQVKAFVLGLLAMNYAGEGVLRAAVTSIRREIRIATDETSAAAGEAAEAARSTKTAATKVVDAIKSIYRTGSPEIATAAAKVKEAADLAKHAAEVTVRQTADAASVARATAALAASVEFDALGQTFKEQDRAEIEQSNESSAASDKTKLNDTGVPASQPSAAG